LVARLCIYEILGIFIFKTLQLLNAKNQLPIGSQESFVKFKH